MNTRKGLNLSGFRIANPMAKYSEFAWSDAACNNNISSNSLNGGGGGNGYMSAGELSLMSRFSLNSSLALQSASDSDATSSSTSSCSVNNNSLNSLPVSPALEREQKDNTKPSIQQHIASNHLLELQKEIKEEEEEIFADINSLINGRASTLFSSLDDPDIGTNSISIDADEDKCRSIFSCVNNCSHINNNICNSTHLRDYNDRLNGRISFPNEGDDLNEDQFNIANSPPNLHDYQNNRGPENHIKNSSERKSNHTSELDQELNTKEQRQTQIHRLLSAEKEDLFNSSSELNEATTNHENNDPNGAPNEHIFSGSCNFQSNSDRHEDIKSLIQQVTNNLPKPCVFFLEGNCRRSDCKYSHDLSNITCKYWIEGFCFKGEMCPFLHSYNPASDQDPSVLDEDALKALKKELNPTFAIESEADFPSLPLDAPATALNDSTKTSINTDSITNTIKSQILSSNPAVVFKTVKRKRKRG